MTQLKAIAAVDMTGAIGGQNKLLCKLEKDLKQFKQLTTGNIVIMGRKTFESIGRPLPNRINIVVSSSLSQTVENSEELIIVATPQDALKVASSIAHLEQHIYVIGGGQIYKELIPYCDELLITEIQDVFSNADTFIDIPNYFSRRQVGSFTEPAPRISRFTPESSKGTRDGDHVTKYFEYRQQASEADLQYKNVCRTVLNNGADRPDRTRTGTKSYFSPAQMRFDLQEGFPLITLKKVPFRIVAEELLWFVSGSTDVRDLHKRNVHIWDADATRHFNNKFEGTPVPTETYRRILQDAPQTAIAGDMASLGPIYGKQWRDFGGVDQLAKVIEGIKQDPYGRRHIVSAWNAADLDKMALPPCHYAFQFYVNDGELSCKFTMRSTDIFLGLPFSIASYALLTHMVAHVTGLQVGELIVDLGDAHIYNNHIYQVRELLSRTSHSAPELEIVGDVNSIDDFSIENFKLTGYHPHTTISAPINVGK